MVIEYDDALKDCNAFLGKEGIKNDKVELLDEAFKKLAVKQARSLKIVLGLASADTSSENELLLQAKQRIKDINSGKFVASSKAK